MRIMATATGSGGTQLPDFSSDNKATSSTVRLSKALVWESQSGGRGTDSLVREVALATLGLFPGSSFLPHVYFRIRQLEATPLA